MSQKRMRVFAGPNGSGKTTIVHDLQTKIRFGVYVNADDIERLLHNTNSLLFDQYKFKISEEEIKQFFRASTFAPEKRKELDLWQRLKVKNNTLYVSTKIDSYIAADIAEFIRQRLIKEELSFTYETVMSHKNKIDFLDFARKEGYKVYLYYVATEDPEINVSRVNVRVAQNGHAVNDETIRNRYFKSLQQLKAAVMYTNRSYVFDNSGTAAVLVAEITDGENVKIIDPQLSPNWLKTYLAP